MTEIELEFWKFVINWIGGLVALFGFGYGVGWLYRKSL